MVMKLVPHRLARVGPGCGESTSSSTGVRTAGRACAADARLRLGVRPRRRHPRRRACRHRRGGRHVPDGRLRGDGEFRPLDGTGRRPDRRPGGTEHLHRQVFPLVALLWVKEFAEPLVGHRGRRLAGHGHRRRRRRLGLRHRPIPGDGELRSRAAPVIRTSSSASMPDAYIVKLSPRRRPRARPRARQCDGDRGERPGDRPRRPERLCHRWFHRRVRLQPRRDGHPP